MTPTDMYEARDLARVRTLKGPAPTPRPTSAKTAELQAAIRDVATQIDAIDEELRKARAALAAFSRDRRFAGTSLVDDRETARIFERVRHAEGVIEQLQAERVPLQVEHSRLTRALADEWRRLALAESAAAREREKQAKQAAERARLEAIVSERNQGTLARLRARFGG